LNLGWTQEDDPSAVLENRRLLVGAISANDSPRTKWKLVTARQVHESHILRIEAEDALAQRLESPEGKAVLEGDGMVTDSSGVLLGTGTADCVPVLVVDPVRRAVGAFHAGWRGTAAGIAEHGIETMRREYGSAPENLLAAIGPSIGACCYTVGKEVREKFVTGFPYGSELFQMWYGTDGASVMRVDLWEANRRQLLNAGLRSEKITTVGECTACTLNPSGKPRYFSHRAQAGKAGRMLNVIGIADEDPRLGPSN
jgi:YfiH family protein